MNMFNIFCFPLEITFVSEFFFIVILIHSINLSMFYNIYNDIKIINLVKLKFLIEIPLNRLPEPPLLKNNSLELHFLQL